MPLHDPVVVYKAATNLEAHLVSNALEAGGVETMVVEDASVVGLSYLGPLAGVHQPQVWVERASIDQAKAVIDRFEQDAARRRDELAAGEPVSVVCEECGKRSSYPASQRGSVQDCSHCGAYVDVDDVPWAEWDGGGDASGTDG
jgi:hypothetical protein